MSIQNIPANFLDNENEFQEFEIPDWNQPTKEQIQAYAVQSFKWADDDVDESFVNELIAELQSQKEKKATQVQ